MQTHHVHSCIDSQGLGYRLEEEAGTGIYTAACPGMDMFHACYVNRGEFANYLGHSNLLNLWRCCWKTDLFTADFHFDKGKLPN